MLPEGTEAVALLRLPGSPVQAYCGDASAQSAHFPNPVSGGFLYAPYQPDGTPFWLLPDNMAIEGARQTIDLWEADLSAAAHSGTSHATYVQQATQFLQGLRDTPLEKAVLSRLESCPKPQGFSAIRCFDHLCAAYPNAVVHLFITRGKTCWMGATPEPLLTVANGALRTTALAGTLPAEKGNDERNWSDKERAEQRMVTDFIRQTLHSQPGVHDIRTGEPRVSQAGTVVHLRTDFSAKTLPDFQWAQLVQQLHPTPAIAGVPRDLALETIQQTEVHPRLYYGGFFGVVTNLNCVLHLNLRCMQVAQNELLLYVGGGFTAQSDIEAEWVETEHKAHTLLSVIEKLRNFENS